MGRLIDADALKKDVLDLHDCYNGFSDTYDKACIIGVIDEQPSVDAVPVGVVEQIRWERDVAMKQLAEHGIPFGGTADDVVPIVRCADCKWWKEPYCVKNYVFIRRADWFCADGER